MQSQTKPEFSFLANSDKEEDQSGVATWTYTTIDGHGDEVENVVSQYFDNFPEAHLIDNLVAAVWESGLKTGKAQAINSMQSTLNSIKK